MSQKGRSERTDLVFAASSHPPPPPLRTVCFFLHRSYRGRPSLPPAPAPAIDISADPIARFHCPPRSPRCFRPPPSSSVFLMTASEEEMKS